MSGLRRYLPLIAFVAGVVLLCGKLLMTPVAGRVTQSPHFVRGWPWVFSEFWGDDESPPGVFTDIGWSPIRFESGKLLGDIAVLSLVAVLLTVLFIFCVRGKRHWFQFSLRTMFVVITLCGVLLGLWTKIYFDWKREQAILTQWDQGSARYWAWVSCGPEWLRRLVPWNHPDIFKRATYFSVRGEDYSRAGFEEKLPVAIGELRYLRHLGFDQGAPHAVHLKDALDLSHVDEIWFHASAIDDDTLRWVGKLTSLKELSVGDSSYGSSVVAQISDDGLSNLRTCTSLESLSFYGPAFGGNGFLQLPGLRNLRRLSICRFQLTHDSLAAIAELKSLEEITFRECDLGEIDGFLSLASLPRLCDLGLDQGRIRPEQIKSLAACRGIKKLSLASCDGVTDQVVDLLRALPLECLHVSDCNELSDRAIETLNEMRTLEVLHIEGCRNISDAGVVRLREKPQLKQLKVRPGQYSQETLTTLEGRVSHLWVW